VFHALRLAVAALPNSRIVHIHFNTTPPIVERRLRLTGRDSVALDAAQFHAESRGTTPINPFATTPPAGVARKFLDCEELGREVDVYGDTVSS